MTKTATAQKRRGPVARAGRARVTVYLDEPLAEWGKRQEGGLSDLLRRLLAEAHEQNASSPAFSGGDVLTRYHALADRKLSAGLTASGEVEWNRLRDEINAADRESPHAREQERAARVLDEEFARLRERIEALPRVTAAP